MLHVHLGPSPLALGLIVPATRDGGFDVLMVGKPGDSSPTWFGRTASSPGAKLKYYPMRWFEGPSEFGDLPPEAVGRIQSSEPVLVTCSLRKHIAQRVAFVQALLRERPVGGETVVMACENAPDRAYADIHTTAEENGVLFLKTVVNRMCIELPPDDRGRRMVSAHPLGEWLIARPDRPSEILTALERAPEVSVVDDILAREDRKLWMVNGAHQALALMARRGNRRQLRTVAREPAVLAWLSYLHAGMNEALRHKHPELADNLAYAQKHVVAYCEHQDSVKRVLGAYRRASLSTFFDNLNERIAEPARICRQHGIDVAPFARVVVDLELVAQNFDLFLDASDLRRGSVKIDPQEDLDAMVAYGRMLSGWLAPEEAERRVRAMRRLLVEQAAGIDRLRGLRPALD